MTYWIDRAAALLGEPIRQHQAMSGGDVAAVARLELASGAVVVAKASPQAIEEATMLRRLAAAGVPTPEVLAQDSALLVLSLIHHDGRVETSWQDLGRVFARLHQTTGPHYGWHADYAFGDVSILNTPCDHWPTFWGQQRLLPLISDLPSELAQRTERLIASLPERLPARPPAALLHGDAWTGNLLVRDGRVVAFIDPACYFGHAEVDLAMLRLFARPGGEFFESYGCSSSESDERLPVYQLWPALVHYRLFGPSYRGLVERLLAGAGVMFRA